MGSGSKKDHENFTVAPTLPTSVAATEPAADATAPTLLTSATASVPGSVPPVSTSMEEEAQSAKDACLEKLHQLEQTDLADTDPGLGYALFKQSAEDAQKAYAHAALWNPFEKPQLHQAPVDSCGAPLKNAPPTWLQKTA